MPMLVMCAVARGLSPEYMLREWHEADGLPTEELGSVVLDGAGYLWVGSSSGLARFDGTAFEARKLPAEVYARGMVYGPVGGARSQLVALGTAGASEGGRAANDGGFFVHTHEGFQFANEPLLAGKGVRTAFFEADGALWLGCEDGTLLRRRGEDRVVFDAPAGALRRRPPVFATDRDERLWVATGSYVARFEEGVWVPVPVGSRENDVRIGSSRTGGVWLLTRGELLRWEEDRFVAVTKLPELLGAHFVQAVLEDSSGNLWIGTRSQGLFRLERTDFVRVPTSNDEITALCEDRAGNLWAATNGGGLNRLRRKAHRIYDQTSGLIDSFSYTVAEGAEGEIWLGNRDGGVARIRQGFVDTLSRRAGWRPFSAMSVHPRAGGGWWITTGIGVFATEAGRPEILQRVPALADTRLVRVTFVARNGDLWLSLDPDRVGRWRDGRLATFGRAEGFDGRELRAIAEDASGAIWLAATEGRLFRSSGEGFERVPLADETRYGALQSLRFENDGTLLVGTTRAGLLIFPKGDFSRHRLLNTPQGLPNNNISQVLADDKGRYWFASRGGVFWIHQKQVEDFIHGRAERVHAVPLGRDDGLPDLSCLGLYQPSAWKAADGSLWFATRRGVLNTDPALVPESEELPPATVVEVRYDGRPRPVEADELSVGSWVRKMEIRFSVLNLTAPDRTVLRHRLEGFDPDWVLAKDRVATYPRLPPGRYTLRVSAGDGTGAWGEQPPLLVLRVVPAWWQSGWARALYVLAGVAAVTISVRVWLLRRWRRRVRQLEQEQALERERTRIAQDIHDDIGASLTRISLLSQSAAQGRPPEPRVLEEIYETTHTITRSMDEIVWAINPKFDDLESLVYYLTTYAQKFLAVAKLRFRLEAPTVLPAVPVTSQARHHIFLCCKEALNNVVKHAAGADEVTLTVSAEAGMLRIEIADNGRGWELAGVAGGGAVSQRVLSGHGMRNMNQRMRELGGTCSVEARSLTGTEVRFSIPLEPPMLQKTGEDSTVM